MKNIMKSLMLFAVAAMGFTACQKEGVEESTNNSVAESTYTMTFVAGAPESRTSVEVDGTTANFSWAEEGETFTFVQNTAEGLKKGTNVTFTNNAGLAEITATFTEAASPIVAVYPENAWASNENTNFNKAKLIVPSDQSILDGTFDPNADLLVSKVVTPENTTDTHNLQFARVVAVGKMTLKNLPFVSTETIQKINFSINSENALTGRLYIDLATAEVSEWGYYDQAFNYVNLINGNVTAAAANDFYFTCMPATVAAGETFTVEVTTNAATYTHSVTIPEGKSIEFKSGRVAEFGVNMATAERATIEGLPLPWSESFDSDDLSKYETTNGGGTTKWYNEKLAEGNTGEILIAKQGGSMTATLASDGEAKTLNFWFKSNKTYIEVSSATEGVTINEVTGADNNYTVALAEGVRIFKITLTNNNSNARVDDIMLTEDAPTVEKITVTGATTSFTVGDTFVFNGTVTATYNNGATEDVTEDATVDSSLVDMGTAGTYTVTVTYNDINTTYNVTVAEESAGGGDEPVYTAYTENFTTWNNNSTSNSSTGTETGNACTWSYVGASKQYWSNISSGSSLTMAITLLKPATAEATYILSEELDGGIKNLKLTARSNNASTGVNIYIIDVVTGTSHTVGTLKTTSKKTDFVGEYDLTSLNITGKYQIKITNMSTAAYCSIGGLTWNY